MADVVADGRTRVSVVPAIANIAAPTTTELNAGLLLQLLLTPAGLVAFQPETAKIDTSSLGSRFNTARNGRTSFDGLALELKKQDTADTAYTTLIYGYQAFVVVRNSILQETAYASAQPLRVYPIECGEVAHVDIEENSLERYRVPLTVRDTPNLRAAVA